MHTGRHITNSNAAHWDRIMYQDILPILMLHIGQDYISRHIINNNAAYRDRIIYQDILPILMLHTGTGLCIKAYYQY